MFLEEWAEHAALRDTTVDSDCGGCGHTCCSILLRHSSSSSRLFSEFYGFSNHGLTLKISFW